MDFKVFSLFRDVFSVKPKALISLIFPSPGTTLQRPPYTLIPLIKKLYNIEI